MYVIIFGYEKNIYLDEKYKLGSRNNFILFWAAFQIIIFVLSKRLLDLVERKYEVLPVFLVHSFHNFIPRRRNLRSDF